MLEAGRPGELYLIGGDAEKPNIEVVHTICALLATHAPGKDYLKQITTVTDRPGHDRRYAIDFSKLTRELGWRPNENFTTGLEKTVRWYLENRAWVADVQSGDYLKWIAQNYGARA